MKTRQYRHEIKFTINNNYARILKDRLLSIMKIDENGKNGYFIRSLYFDTPSSDAYYEKMDGVLYRKKYRIRLYNQDKDFIRLEKKLKLDNMTSKEQTKISKEECEKLINGDVSYFDFQDELLKHFALEIKARGLKPSVIVDYERLALTYPVSDVRITFDYNIRSGKYNYNLFEFDNNSQKVIDDDQMILEVKYNEFLPSPIAAILSTIPSARQAFSKFAACRSIK